MSLTNDTLEIMKDSEGSDVVRSKLKKSSGKKDTWLLLLKKDLQIQPK